MGRLTSRVRLIEPPPSLMAAAGQPERAARKGHSMQVRVTTVQIQPGRIDEAIRLYQDSVVPAAKQQRGYRSTMLVTDRMSGKGMAITVWESAADLQASEASGYYQEQVAKFAPLLTAAPVREAYELSVMA
jgi:quinol monooxygenase YgiN